MVIALASGGEGSAADSTREFVLAVLGNEDAGKIRGSIIVGGRRGGGRGVGGGGRGVGGGGDCRRMSR